MISCSYKQDSRRIQLYDLSYRLKNLTDAEVEQLEAIGDTTISAAQWGYLGAMDQGVATTDNVTFNRVYLSDYGYALGGFHVGGTSDPAGNLVVEGNITLHNAKLLYTDAWDSHIDIIGGAGAASQTYIRLFGKDHSTYPNWIHIYGGGTLRYKFDADGNAYADIQWTTFSPDITKDLEVEEPTYDDYLNWALEDAEKPVKPYTGLWTEDKTEEAELVRALARSFGIESKEDEIKNYAKNPAKIAIGTARWAKHAREQINFLKSEIARLEKLVSKN